MSDEKTILVGEIPKEMVQFVNGKRVFDPKEINIKTQKLSVIYGGLDKLSYEIKLRDGDAGESFDIIAIPKLKNKKRKDIIKDLKKIEENATKIAEQIVERAEKPDLGFINLPEKVRVDPNHEGAPEFAEDMLIVDKQSRVQQVLDIQKELEQGDVQIGEQVFKKIEKKSQTPIKNRSEKTSTELSLQFVKIDEKNRMWFFVAIGQSWSPPIKAAFSQQATTNDEHLQLAKHVLCKDKTSIVVKAVVSEKFDPKIEVDFENEKDIKRNKITGILIEKILDFGLDDFENQPKLWE